MKVIDVPFAANVAQGWALTGVTEGEHFFDDRAAALAYAVDYAKRYAFAVQGAAYICIEGGDGKWRLFTPDLQPVARVPQPA